MTRSPLRFSIALVVLMSLGASWASPQETAIEPVMTGYQRILTDSERVQITLAVLKDHPVLAGSPGIKFAVATPSYMADELGHSKTYLHAYVVFYPHSESRGVKVALQANCKRDFDATEWECFGVHLRRYVKFEFQDYEVRLVGNLSVDGAAAVIAATRGPAAEAAKATTEVADTAIGIFEANEGFVVSWGSKDGMGRVGMEAQLKPGGNPTQSEDWLVKPEREL